MRIDLSKKISIVFLILAIGMIFFFTFQNREASFELTEKLRIWLSDHGIKVRYETLRTNAHLVEYFILGLALMMFIKIRGGNCWTAITIGCGIGLFDEMLKILLSGREFGKGDLIRDFIGVWVAAAFLKILREILYKQVCMVEKNSSTCSGKSSVGGKRKIG